MRTATTCLPISIRDWCTLFRSAGGGEPYVLPNQGDDTLDSDVDPISGIRRPVVLAPGETNLTVDAGVLKLKADVRIEKSTNGQDADMPTGPVIPVGEPVTWTMLCRTAASTRSWTSWELTTRA